MEQVKNILFVGVGGQGTILASKILSEGLVEAGFDVKMSEIHGMAQRGGSVSTQVRYGSKVYSPIIGIGQADILVCFEAMEALRYLDFLKIGGKILVNDYKIPSAPILSGQQEYPDNVIEIIKEKADATIIDAANIAEKIGNSKIMNVVLLGALVKAMKLDFIDWDSVIRKIVKEKFVAMNIEALDQGKKLVK